MSCDIINPMTLQVAEPQTKRWTREQFYRLSDEGWFSGQRVQLIEGRIIQMPPQGHAHVLAVVRTRKALERVFGQGFWIREEKPLNVGAQSDPEPDLAVAQGLPEEFTDHPATAVLVVEVSDSSLALDRKKADLYASAMVQQYWIVNLPERRLEVHRGPLADASSEFGHRYAIHEVIMPGQNVMIGQGAIALNDLLP